MFQAAQKLGSSPNSQPAEIMTTGTLRGLPARESKAVDKANSARSSPEPEQPLRGALAADPPLEPTPALLDELAQQNHALETASPQQILEWAAGRFAPGLTMATAFGPEGCYIIHMLSKIAPDTHVFNLETGYQFKETLQLRDRLAERYGLEVELRQPELNVQQYEQLHGGPLYNTNPNRCCFERKIVVLHQAVRGKYAWVSAIRRDQSPDRAGAPIVGWDNKFQLVKVNPLANCTKNDIWTMITEHDIPYNPLHDEGYTSIGCRPCTRMVMFGEDDRAGRWSGSSKTECGLHTLDDNQP